MKLEPHAGNCADSGGYACTCGADHRNALARVQGALEARFAEDEALDLLMQVVSMGRNGQPYRHLLPELRKALQKAPLIKQAMIDSTKGVIW